MAEENIVSYLNYYPDIDASSYIDKTAKIIGHVKLQENCSVWPNSVIRGDVNYIKIGKNTNIQDLSVIHVTQPIHQNKKGSPTIIGDDVTIGHRVVLHGCTIGNRVLIGMGTIVLDDAQIQDDVLIGAGSLVTINMVLESGYLYLGTPVKKIRKLKAEEIEFLKESAKNYVQLKNDYLKT